MFEIKFKGSLDKLDEFEKDWATFKSASGIQQSLTQPITPMLKGSNSNRHKDYTSGLKAIIEDEDVDFTSKTKQMDRQPQPQ